ncbi:MAG: deoxyribonuclease V [Blastocatellia bacterium]
MPIKPPQDLHSWHVTPTEAVTVQRMLRDQVVIQPLPENIALIAGADISYNKFSEVLYAAIVVLRLPTLEVVETVSVVSAAKFPYVPGLLSFREAPSVLEAFAKLSMRPDVMMLDGHGIAHPRRFGVASHIGLWTGVPTIGCGKTLLIGDYDQPDENAGAFSPLTHKGDIIGGVLRTKDRTNPVFISPGHMADLPTALALAMRCVRKHDKGAAAGASKYRIPEPTRLAHLCVNATRRGETFTPPH